MKIFKTHSRHGPGDAHMYTKMDRASSAVNIFLLATSDAKFSVVIVGNLIRCSARPRTIRMLSSVGSIPFRLHS